MNHRLLAHSLLLLLTAGQLTAQDPAEEAGETFFDTVDVRVVNVEVVVTDEKTGEVVTGLGPEDFRLLVDGEALPIEYFSEVRDGVARAPAAEATAEPAEPAAPAAVPAVASGEAVGTSYLLFVDRFFGVKRDLKRVLGKIREDVATFGPRDRLAIVGYDGQQLEAIAGWTDDRQKMQRALDSTAALPSYGVQRLGERNLFERQRAGPGAALIEQSDDTLVRDYARRLDRQVDQVLQAARTAMRTFAATPGRKVLLLTSGGWPTEPASYALGVDPEIRFWTETLLADQSFRDLVDTANLLGYTIYPIDLPGRTGNPGARADEALAAGGVAAANDLDDRLGSASRDTLREYQVESTLIVAAEQTGGVPLLNGGRDTALADVRADLASYYWLGFSPERRRDDGTRAIEVEVLRPGLVARSRASYRDLSRRADVAMQVESHLLFESEIEGARPLDVELGKPKKAQGAGVEMPVTVRIPLDEVTMLETGEGFRAELELRVAIIDSDGHRNVIPVIPIRFAGNEMPVPGQHVTYETALVVRTDKQRLVVALHDLVGDAVLAAAMDFHPKKM